MVVQAESAPSPQVTPSESPSPSADRRPRKRNLDAVALIGIGIAFSLFYTALSFLRFTEFYGGNWDLGINMQAAWTSTHGYLAYNTGNAEFIQAGSFLFVHPTYVLFPVSWLYDAAPFAVTLFAVQAVVLATSTVPLYLIGRRAGVPSRLLLAGLVVYLVSIPILSGYLYDFHWEAFIPAEFLWTFYLWDRGRYWWALVAATFGFLTLEVFPVLVVGIAAYFAWPYIRAFLSPPRKRLHQVWSTLKGPALPLVGLVVAAVVGYVGPALFALYVLPSLTGGAPVFPSSGPNSYLGFLYWGFSVPSLGSRLTFWLVLFASFGFLPLLFRQRLLILSIPWGVYSVVVTSNSAFTTFGFQYSLLAVAPLAIGFVEGLGAVGRVPSSDLSRRLPTWGWLLLVLPFLGVGLTEPIALIRPTPADLWIGLIIALWVAAGALVLRFTWRAPAASDPARPRRRSESLGRPRVTHAIIAGALVILVGSNVAFSPLNPGNFLGNGDASYSFTYNPSPSYAHMSAVVERIPADSSVLASNNLFPFVANNPHAWSLLWYPAIAPYLPFNSSNLPAFVLLSSSEWYVPSFLDAILYNESDYGLVAVVFSSISYPGSIYLFERGYSGPDDIILATTFPARTVLCGNDLAIGPSGMVVPAASSRCGAIVETQRVSNLSGNNATIWYGPYSSLLPGNYTVTASIEGALSGPGPNNSAVLIMNANALGTAYWYYTAIQENELSTTQWTNFTYHFELAEPHPQAEWRGYVAGATVDGHFVPGTVKLNFIEIDYTPSPT